ncbi:putative tail fiber protein [Xanthomonas phage X2]|nr:putative tail fiber protein [Xanthomonas phage X2]
MADLPEQPAGWPGIPMISTSDPVLGGQDGPANRQAAALISRLQTVRNLVDAATAALATVTPQVDQHVQTLNALQASVSSVQTSVQTVSGVATAAQTAASVADAKAVAAQTAATARAVRIDLGTVTVTYTASTALVAGARSIAVACTGAQVGDAIFVAATNAIPDGYAVGAAQCLVADTIRVSVIYPALSIGNSFSISLRVFALR